MNDPDSPLHSLLRRAGVLRDIPDLIAQRLRALIAEEVVAPMRAAYPFIGDSLSVL